MIMKKNYLTEKGISASTEKTAGRNARQQDEIKSRALLDAVPQIVWSTDSAGVVEYANQRASEYSECQQTGHARWTWLSVVHPDDRGESDAAWRRSLETGNEFVIEQRLRRNDGEFRWHLTNGAALRGEGGRVEGWIITARDIHDHKKAEGRYHSLFENIPEMVAVYEVVRDGNGEIQERIVREGNPAFVRVANAASIDELRGKTAGEIFGRDYADGNLPLIRKAMDSGSVQTMESRLTSKGRYYLTTIVPLDEKCYLVTGRDITGQKTAEEALRESRARYRTALDAAGLGTWHHDLLSDMIHLDARGQKHFGIESEKVTSAGLFDRIHPDDRERFEKEFDAIPDPSIVTDGHSFEYRVVLPDGDVRWLSIHSRVRSERRKDSGDRILRYGTSQDITERKKDETELVRSQSRFKILSEASFEGIAISENGRFTDMNDQFCAMVGYAKSELVGREIALLLPPDDFSRVIPKIIEGVENVVEHRVVRKDGTVITVEAHGKPWTIDGRNARVTAVRDITERKRIEEALRESEERFRAIVSSTPDHILVQDHDLRYLFVANSQLGITESDMVGKTDHDIIGKEDADRLTRVKTRVLKNGKPVHIEMPIITRDGERRFFEGAYVPKYDARGHIDGLIGYFRDVTERKRMEESLRTSEARFRLALKSAPVAVAAQDTDLRYTYVYNFPLMHQETVIGRTDADLLAPDEAARMTELKRRAMISGEEVREFLWVTVNEKRLFLDIYIDPVRNDEGKITGIGIAMVNMTAMKLVEEALASRAAELAAVFSAQQDIVLLYDLRMNVLQSNPSFRKIYGFDPTGLNLRDIIHRVGCRNLNGEPLILEEQPTPKALRGENVKGACFLVRRADGSDIAVETSSGPMSIAGRIVGSVTVWHDITERIKSEEALRQSTDRFALLAMIAGELLNTSEPLPLVESLCRRVMEHLNCEVFFNFLVDERAGRLHLNAYAGVQDDEAMRVEWLDFGSAVCGCAARDACRIIAEHIPSTSDPRTELIKSFGIKAYACHPLLGEGGKVIGTLSFGTRERETFSQEDISLMRAVSDHVAMAMVRKMNEEALRESEERFDFALKAAQEGVWDWNVETDSTFHSHQWMRMLGYSEGEITPSAETWRNMLHPDDRERVFSHMASVLRGECDYDIEFRLRHKEGHYVYILSRGFPVRDKETGRIVRIVGTHFDLSERKKSEESLKKSEERYRSLVELSPNAIFVNRDDRIVLVNPAMLELVGASSAEQLLGKSPYAIFHPDCHSLINEHITDLRQGISVKLVEIKIVRLDGSVRDVEAAASPIVDSEGPAIQVVMRDISERKRIEQELIMFNERLERQVMERTAELMIINENLEREIVLRNRIEAEKEKVYAELDIIFNSTTVGMTVIDREYNFIRANNRFRDMLFLDTEDIVGKKCFDLWEQDKCNTEFCPLKKILSGVREYEYEMRIQNSTGDDMIVQINAVPYYSISGEVTGMIQNVIDITEKREIQRKLITIIDEERKMISHDLHDGLGQNLTAVGFLIESIRQKMLDPHDPTTMKLEEIGNLIQISQSQTRTLSKMLSPVEMEQTGFKSSLETLAANMERVYGIKCAILSTGDIGIRDNYVATHLYYIVREAVNNAIKHGRPKNIIIQISDYEDYIVITIKDDGRGIGNMVADEGMGLKIMKHRAEIIGASFNAGSFIDGGFAVVVKLPV